MKKFVIMAGAMLLCTSAAMADRVSQNGITCKTLDSKNRIEIQNCSGQASGDGGGTAQCSIIVTPPNGKALTTRVVGRMKHIGGIHPIKSLRRSVVVLYERGGFSCSYTPPDSAQVGDCVQSGSTATCTVVRIKDGARTYFSASGSAKTD
jgi:hypothetical protein